MTKKLPLTQIFNSKATRFVWTLNGYLFLLVLLFVLGQLVSEINFSDQGDTPQYRGLIVGRADSVARQLNVSVQHLEYEQPTRIANSPFYYASVYVLDKDMPEEIREAIHTAGDISRNMIGARINVLFFKGDRSQVHKLLVQNGYVHRIDAPTASQRYGIRQRDSEEDHPRHILYQIALRDSNSDHRINEDDAMAFYLSDLTGNHLKQISPDSLHLTDYWYTADYSEIYFEEIIEDLTETIDGYNYRLQERKLYYYNMESEQFGAFDQLQDVFRDIEADYQSKSE